MKFFNGMENEQPLVSVIIPSYNHQKYIAQAIESVLNQTYKNIQLIVIDDGSTDASFEIITQLSNRHNFIAIKQKNKGLSSTFNRGIKDFSKGYFISCLASDDFWAPTKIEKQVSFFQKTSNQNCMMCCSKVYLIDGNNKITCESGVIDNKEKLSFEKVIIYNPIKAVTVMLKREVFNMIGYYDESLRIEDLDLWLRIADKTKIGYINENLAYYRIHESNSSNKQGWIKLIDDKFRIIDKWKHTAVYDQAMKAVYLQKIDILNSVNNKKAAFLLWLKCFRYFTSIGYWKEFIKILVRF